MNGCVYVITNSVNKKQYVGQTIRTPEVRWRVHKQCMNNGTDSVLYRAMRKHGIDRFSYEVVWAGPKSRLDAMERKFIKDLRTTTDLGGYNLTAGGDGVNATDAVRKKMSNSAKLRWSDPKVHKKLAAIIRTALDDPEVRARKLESQKRTCADLEFRKRQSEDVKRRFRSKRERQLASQRQKAYAATGVGRQVLSDQATKMWKNPAIRAKLTEVRRRQCTPEVKVKLRAAWVRRKLRQQHEVT